ncbi:MAG: glycosyltransferase [Paludibacteraceae bacterium]|nr:glycosyltransferase [Paludibacteraceae bacterium]
MIPKIIHYCWFGRGEMPDLVKTCIASWHTHMPDWEYRSWNEENFDIASSPDYVQEAYAAKKYAFVSDYVRLWALEREGGLYMDVDFEVYKPFDDLMEPYDAFAGYEGSKRNPVMMGVIAAKAHHPWIQDMLLTYHQRSFIQADSSYDMTPNTGYFFDWMQERGFVADGQEKDFIGVHILPVECFCPILTTGENLCCERTYCEHKGLHSWSGNGGWKEKVLNVFGAQWKTKLIKLKRKIFG